MGALLLTVGLEHAEDLGAGDGADLGDTVGVTQDNTDLQGNRVQKANVTCQGSVKTETNNRHLGWRWERQRSPVNSEK